MRFVPWPLITLALILCHGTNSPTKSLNWWLKSRICYIFQELVFLFSLLDLISMVNLYIDIKIVMGVVVGIKTTPKWGSGDDWWVMILHYIMAHSSRSSYWLINDNVWQSIRQSMLESDKIMMDACIFLQKPHSMFNQWCAEMFICKT